MDSIELYAAIKCGESSNAQFKERLLVVNIEEGFSKPYKDTSGTIYIKNGADKRKVTSNDEIACSILR